MRRDYPRKKKKNSSPANSGGRVVQIRFWIWITRFVLSSLASLGFHTSPFLNSTIGACFRPVVCHSFVFCWPSWLFYGILIERCKKKSTEPTSSCDVGCGRQLYRLASSNTAMRVVFFNNNKDIVCHCSSDNVHKTRISADILPKIKTGGI